MVVVVVEAVVLGSSFVVDAELLLVLLEDSEGDGLGSVLEEVVDDDEVVGDAVLQRHCGQPSAST